MHSTFKQASPIRFINEGEDLMDAHSFVFNSLKEAIEQGASDIHIEPSSDQKGMPAFQVRFRVDGRCFNRGLFSDMSLYRGIVNKLKLDAGLKIDERRLPQDGRISFDLETKVYNFRLSFMPATVRNAQEEKIVLRQMADVTTCDLETLDLVPHHQAILERAVQLPHGFICVTGPTGSGKTTLLYALLKKINREEKNCMTLEDPIEAEIPLVNQSQMFHRIGYDFAQALRVTLRQDPDIIMVGEMRDEETASKAFEAANTGHLVLSTLHTNTAASTITRLLQMKVPRYFISSSLKYVIAQRLVRRLCPSCKLSHPDKALILKAVESTFKESIPAVQAYFEACRAAPQILTQATSTSCQECLGVGFKGRLAIMEILEVNPSIRHLIHSESGNELRIQEVAEKEGMMTMKHYGYLQLLKGVTTFEEINQAVLSH